MADFVAVLKKTLDGLGETTPATRERVYEKARATIGAKLAAIMPPPAAGVADRQKRALEDAIASIEREFEAADALDDPLAELENVFAQLKNPQPKFLPPQPAAKVAEAWPKVTPVPAVPKPSKSPEPELPQSALVEIADEGDSEEFDEGRVERRPKRNYGGLVAIGLVLAVVAGGGYGVWLNKDAFGNLLGSGTPQVAATPPAEETVAPAEVAVVPPVAEPVPAEAPAAEAAATAVPAPETAAAAAPAADAEGKFTQRLTAEGGETDPGPANGESSIGEGTSVAALTQPPPAAPTAPAATSEAPAVTIAPVDPALPATSPAESAPAAAETAPPVEASLPIGQKAIFYEERTSSAEGSAEPGSIVWSLVQESPGGNLPPEPAIRAEATIPGKDVQLRMTIRRNADKTLPASHIIEMIFLTPDGFEGGGIENILRIAMKGSEQEAGNPLIGIPAKIADGFFLVALNDTKAEIDANMTLLRRQSWIDVPVVYKSGRRALFTMEKGIPGDKVFDEALKAWQAAAASTASTPG